MVKLRTQYKSFGGTVGFYTHESVETKSPMNFSVFLPDSAGDEGTRLPVLYWLSGLTCTDENFMQKSGIQKLAARHKLIVVAPDTSPRGLGLAGENESWSFGEGAGFYVDATEEPWSRNYRMYSWVAKELPDLIRSRFPVDHGRQSIFGHSMGGHGALVIALKNPGMFRSASAFSPICAPTRCPWGTYAFERYLGHNQEIWKDWDTVELLKKQAGDVPMLVDQGSEDEFLKSGQLRTDLLQDVVKETSSPAEIRMQTGYDHSYYFVGSFLEDHVRFHDHYLRERD